jgi:enoyl-CoA hydratase
MLLSRGTSWSGISFWTESYWRRICNTVVSKLASAAVSERLNRPEQLNSMNQAFWSELPAAISQLESEPDVRVIVISSTGQHFSAGMDLSVFQGGDWLTTDTARDRRRLRELVLTLQNCFTALEKSRVPVIAAIQGGCIGGAVDMVAACDMRYATSSTFFCIQEINLAMMADLGTLQRLPKLMPAGIVRQLAFTGDRMPASEARSFGLVNEVFESEEEMQAKVMEVARKIAARSPIAVAATKEALNFARDHSVEESLRAAADLQAAIFDVSDIQECFKAKKEKREPQFAEVRSVVAV